MSDEGSGEDEPEEDDPEEDDPEEDGEHRENDAAINNDEEFYEGASEIDSVS
jgi:hypothetical protein